MSKVRAAVMERPGRIALHEFPMPEPAAGCVLMKVRYSGICGTDKHLPRREQAICRHTPGEGPDISADLRP
jgi:D-arabinose 1-dehydrogenase-like Zn-dependent alcohol dehydrogenase